MGDVAWRVAAVAGGFVALVGLLVLVDELLFRRQHPGPRVALAELADPDSDCDGLIADLRAWRRP